MARSSKKSTNVTQTVAGSSRAGSWSKEARTNAVDPTAIPLELQQTCLNIFRDTLQPDAEDSATVQELKGHLYRRDFASAFGGNQDYLRVYASRWSPSRALAYLQIFSDISSHESSVISAVGDGVQSPLRVVCIGGGAGGELIGLAAWFGIQSKGCASSAGETLHVGLFDIADWKAVTETLQTAITQPPQLSPYASRMKKDANKALISPENIATTFHQEDVLKSTSDELLSSLRTADLVTCMFTLNELYSTSVPKTQQLLQNLTECLRPGASLLVVDSPGSYSTVAVNGTERKYPMKWLLDYTLRGPEEQTASADDTKWERLLSDDSRWFRLPQNLEYPIELESMRYQIYVYRRADAGG